MSSDRPSIPIAEMRETSGEGGRTYLTGDLGFARLVIVKSDRTAEDGRAIWDVLVQQRWQHPTAPDDLLPDPL